MSNPQHIIVYRNPMEYALWNEGLLFPIMVATVVGFVLALLAAKLCDTLLPWQKRNWTAGIVTTVAILGVAGTIYWLV